MAHPTSRLSTLPSHLRQSSAAGGLTSSSSAASGAGASPALVARINDKKAELESLRQLRDLSADLAGQMEALQGKLEILGNGTEAVAAVLANWHNVLRAISMASSKIPRPKQPPADGQEPQDAEALGKKEEEAVLPQTLVRIPVEDEETMARARSGDASADAADA